MKKLYSSFILFGWMLLFTWAETVYATQAPADNGFFEEYFTPPQTVPEAGKEAITYLEGDYDMTYSGKLDEKTGQKAEEDQENQGQEDQEESVIMFSENMGYDTALSKYVNYVNLDKNKKYYSSLPPGMITNGEINFDMGTRSQYVLYKNGEAVKDADVANITEEGSYILESFDDNNANTDRFSFTIIKKETKDIRQFVIPAGFSFTAITVNEEKVGLPSGQIFNMESDGQYSFEFLCEETGISYRTQIAKDTVPPQLQLTGLTGDVAKGPVQLARVSEESSEISVIKDGENVTTPFDLKLSDYGKYKITVTDSAGNSQDYSFTIQLYFTMTSLFVFLLFIMIAAGLCGYYKYVKKHLRVR